MIFSLHYIAEILIQKKSGVTLIYAGVNYKIIKFSSMHIEGGDTDVADRRVWQGCHYEPAGSPVVLYQIKHQ